MMAGETLLMEQPIGLTRKSLACAMLSGGATTVIKLPSGKLIQKG